MDDKEKGKNIFDKGFSELFKVFNISFGTTDRWLDYVFYRPLITFPEMEAFIEELEDKASEQSNRFTRIDEKIDYDSIQLLFAELRYDHLMSVRMGLDFDLELREQEHLITGDRYPSLWLAFVTIPGDKGHGLDKENHGIGYHIHYIEFQTGRRKRTNVVFTFDPHEPPKKKLDKLYWYYHSMGKYIHKDPTSFGVRRKRSIYDCATPFLEVTAKVYFANPPDKSAIFYP